MTENHSSNPSEESNHCCLKNSFDERSLKEAEAIAQAAAEKAVQDVLQKMGIDTADPIEVQRNMQYLDAQRKASDKISVSIKVSLIGMVITGFVSVLVMGIRASMNLSGS